MSIKLEQAARQALEALELCGTDDMAYIKSEKAITALREALAEQTEQEPVAWGRVFDGDIIDCICPEEHSLNEGDYNIPLYAAPVRTKDLTDDEVMQTYTNFNLNELGEQSFMIGFARSVIAADREKNK